MMYDEFSELMGNNNVSYEYYKKYIEIDYMDSEYTNKFDYVENFKKEVKNGTWDIKIRYIQRMKDMCNKYVGIIEEKDEQLAFYKEEHKKYTDLRNKYKQIENIIKGL